ncbi:alpha/beta fold hydrolase [Streptomyces sp. NPDC058678]|uniref:alpha/beta fold hydrolase n=1 Tax=Streptomyces sp. NPDC058678 TaxID=3346595 RepID=UPI00365F2486
MITLIGELGEEQTVVVGHNWGAPVARTTAMLRPDKIRAVAGGVFRGQGGSGNPLSAVAPLLHGPMVLPGCGHWTQQERPAEVNAALLDFLARIDGPAPR